MCPTRDSPWFNPFENENKCPWFDLFENENKDSGETALDLVPAGLWRILVS